ncbi:lysylphosphatidylglycerol synthase transmembrane domain-containing protein [Crocinitomix algicola]|uniref:lysylphosphatidylglycerol synthase domain-containing protein n=1 Tax=Crocinitomix algicola TaxID=1740263 RepID=UPI00082AF1DB|nr:lysylphosphatidylglycerol synthase domain-containing protein [Crocinitomix algicola]
MTEFKIRSSPLLFGLKLVFGVGLIVMVIYRLYEMVTNQAYDDLLDNTKHYQYAILAILLMPINWSLEALKWKALILPIKPIRFAEAIKAVLAGLSTGIMTPNRVGNFIGRIAFIDKADRTHAAFFTLIANLAQFVVSIGCGTVAFLFTQQINFEISTYFLQIISLFILIFGILIYLKPSRIVRKPLKRFLPKDIEESVKFVSEASSGIKLKIIGLSLFRYGIFVSQYVLIVFTFMPHLSIYELYMHIMLVYLLVTVLPSLIFGKLFMREAAALIVLSAIGVSTSVILLTGFILWFVNIALPALVGGFFLIRNK